MAASHAGGAMPPSPPGSGSHQPRPDGDGAFAVDAEKPTTKEEARERWEEFLGERFVRGRDEDFDYGEVDGRDELDVLERRDEEDAYFDEEEPGWASGDEKGEKRLEGETGIQDY